MEKEKRADRPDGRPARFLHGPGAQLQRVRRVPRVFCGSGRFLFKPHSPLGSFRMVPIVEYDLPFIGA
jgi:hypothetical protein